MYKDELRKASNERLFEALDYCGYDAIIEITEKSLYQKSEQG